MEVDMEEDIIKIGMIPKRVLKEFSLPNEKSTVFVLRKTLDMFAERYPKDYLLKIAEAKRILAHPVYMTFNKNKKLLYLVKEYIVGKNFKKAAIVIDVKKQAHLIDIILLNERAIEENIKDDMPWLIASQRK